MSERSWTNQDLIEEARRRPYKLDERKISFYTEKGLLDRIERQPTGRGSKPGVRSDHQAELLWTVLQHAETARKPATLANIPVFVWLGWGDTYVPIRQVRRCLRTYAEAHNTGSQAAARRTTDELIEALHLINVPKRARNELADVISQMTAISYENLDTLREPFHHALRGVVAPDGTSLDLPHIDAIVNFVDLRVRAFHVFYTNTDEDELPDAAFRRAQLNWRETRHDYIRDTQLPITDINQDMATNACISLLALLGHELRNHLPREQ